MQIISNNNSYSFEDYFHFEQVQTAESQETIPGYKLPPDIPVPVATSDIILSPSEEVVHYSGIALRIYAKYFWTGGHLIGNVFLLTFGLITYFSILVAKSYYLVWWMMAASTEANITGIVCINNDTVYNNNPLLPLTLNDRIFLFVGFCTRVSLIPFPSQLVFTWIPAIASHRLHSRILCVF